MKTDENENFSLNRFLNFRFLYVGFYCIDTALFYPAVHVWDRGIDKINRVIREPENLLINC